MFKYKKTIGGHVSAPELERCKAKTTIPAGAALVLSGGEVGLCGATAVPTHISESSGAAGEMIACYAVMPGMIFEVPVTAAPAAEGSKVTIDGSALKVTATTTSGDAIVVDKNGATKAGDKIYVKFS